MAETPELTMAKAKGRPKQSGRVDRTAKIDAAILNRAKIVAGHRGVPVAELLSELLREPLDRAYLQMVRELEGKGGKH